MKNTYKVNPIFQLIPRKKFDELAIKWEMDKGIRSFSTWEQTCSLILMHILKLNSYREIDATLGIAKSTFSDALSNRSHGFFADLCDLILLEVKHQSSDRRVRSAVKNLLAIDSSECRVHGSLYDEVPWRRERNALGKKAGLKLHVVWNVDNEWIEDFRITPARRSDTPVSKEFKILPEKIYVFDRAYTAIDLWWKIIQAKADFVGRLKCHQVKEKELLRTCFKKDGILYDGIWQPSYGGLYNHPEVDKNIKFRHIIYRDPETEKIFHFATSNFNITALEVAAIYKKRWAIETLFRWLKGHLNIRYIAVKNINAVKILLSIAVLVQLLIQLKKIVSSFKGSSWDCLRKIRMTILKESLTSLGICPDCRWNSPTESCLVT